MFRIEVAAADLAESRFAFSPLGELEKALRLLFHGSRHTSTAPWVRAKRERLHALVRSRPELAVLRTLTSARHYGAGFLAPPPRGVSEEVTDQLAAVRDTPLDTARRQVGEVLNLIAPPSPEVRAILERDDIVPLLADLLRQAWDALVGPDWPLLRAVLERDVVHRAGRLTRHGWASAVEDLHDHVRWRDGGIELLRFDHGGFSLAGHGLLLIPSIFIWPGLGCSMPGDPGHPYLEYPARGVAGLFGAPQHTGHGLDRLVGAERARVLLTLETPTSTSQLVRLLGRTLGGTSAHLKVLHEAGLLTRERQSRSVLYRRTPLGDALVAGAAAPASTHEASS